MRVFAPITLLFLVSLVWASGNSIPTREQGFRKDQLLRTSSLQFTNPAGFSTQQTYSFRYTGSSMGSQSSGVYLNTLSYQFSVPLTLSVDIGLYNLMHSSGQQTSFYTPQQANSGPSDTKPEFLLPRIGLDYRPTNNLLFSVQLMQMPDAYKAYGPYPFFTSPYSRW